VSPQRELAVHWRQMRQRAVAAAAAQRTGLRSSSDFLYIGQAEGGCAAGAGFAAYIGQPLGGEEAASGIAIG